MPFLNTTRHLRQKRTLRHSRAVLIRLSAGALISLVPNSVDGLENIFEYYYSQVSDTLRQEVARTIYQITLVVSNIDLIHM